MNHVTAEAILDRATAGERLSTRDARVLFDVPGDQLPALMDAAAKACTGVHGNRVTFVINRNVNFTNVCRFNCRFCAFHVKEESRDAFFLTPDDVAAKARDALVREPGCTEICIQGGLHPRLTMDIVEAYIAAIKKVDERLHVHGFSPQEIWNLSRIEKSSVKEIVDRLREAGLGSVPGTAAEILVDEVRRRICPSKVTTEQWAGVIETVHTAGLPSTSTIMYGHVESIDDIVAHLDVIRRIQDKTGGFTEFVPLPFQREAGVDGQLARDARAPSGVLDVKLHAIARLFLAGSIDNIQCSWVKLGKKFSQVLLHAGVNDFSGTLMEENISRSAGAMHGEYIPSGEMVALIQAAGKVPVQRTTTYGVVQVHE